MELQTKATWWSLDPLPTKENFTYILLQSLKVLAFNSRSPLPLSVLVLLNSDAGELSL